MSSKVCYCPKCNLDEPFNPNECMFCPKKLPKAGGSLRSKNGARMCVTCLKKCYDLLIKSDKEEEAL